MNTVLATDFFNDNAQALRNERWDKAFRDDGNGVSLEGESSNLKATVVIESLVQASDISHTMQPWTIYQQWNERLFREKCMIFDTRPSSKEPEKQGGRVEWTEAEKGRLFQFE